MATVAWKQLKVSCRVCLRRWEVLDGGRSCREDKASLGAYLYVNVFVCICATEEESGLKNSVAMVILMSKGVKCYKLKCYFLIFLFLRTV